MKNEILIALAFQVFKKGLEAISNFMHEQDFHEIGDRAINAAEGHFKEGTILDEVVEMACKQLRKDLGIPDSNPDN